MTPARAPKRLCGSRCERGHVHAPQSSVCPECGARATPTRLSHDATLVLVTTVRVNPSGDPFRLGVAVTRCGRARVLCRVEGVVRGSGRDRVTLEENDGVVAARGRRTRR